MFWSRVPEGPIALIAGQGEFPLLFADAVSASKRELVVFGIKDITDRRVEAFAKESHYVELGALGRLVDLLKGSNLKHAVFAGAVPKAKMIDPAFELDATAKGFIASTRHRGDDKLLRAFELFLKANCGISIIDSRKYLKHVLAKRGVMTRRKPTKEEWTDIKFGLKMAKGIGKLDIGQTVVVKAGVVLAVEAIEGTDRALLRGGELSHGDAVAVKVSKPGQDLRFDLPCMGLETLSVLKEAKIRVLGIEAGKTLMLRREALVQEADRLGMTIVGL